MRQSTPCIVLYFLIYIALLTAVIIQEHSAVPSARTSRVEKGFEGGKDVGRESEILVICTEEKRHSMGKGPMVAKDA